MTALTSTQRKAALLLLSGKLLQDGPIEYTKKQLFDAIDNIDTWVDDNAVSFNNALPTIFKSTASSSQKSKALGIITELKTDS